MRVGVHGMLNCAPPCVCVLLGQSLQNSGQQYRLLGLLEDPEVDEENNVESLCVLWERGEKWLYTLYIWASRGLEGKGTDQPVSQ